jgi:ribonuclease BN (tRNA processing enzyme)
VSEVVFVGTSDAFGAGGRRQSAIFVRGPSGGVLLDCGTTTATGLNDLKIERDEIETIIVSHFHGDHFGGLPLLLLAALYEDQRKHALRIAGPPGIESRVHELASAMGHPIETRDWSFPIHFEELPAGRELELGPARVRSFETNHSPDSLPHGLILDTGSERIAYSGDTGWFDALPLRVAGAHLFICECTYSSNVFDYHLDYEQLTRKRSRFDCDRIVLTHLGEQMSERRGRCAIETADDGLTLRIS